MKETVSQFKGGMNGLERPGQVVQYHRQQMVREDGRHWTQKDLAHALNLTEQAICLMEKKDLGLEGITRRRLLTEILHISPMLLGLAEIPLIDGAGLWWVACGYPAFEAGDNGFPRPGQVIRHYRKKKTREDGKHWTQKDLAQTLDLTEQAICLMEKKDLGLESVTRRRLLIETLDIPPPLLGLAEQFQSKAVEPLMSALSRSALDISYYEQQLQWYWDAHHRRASYKWLGAIQETISHLYQAMPFSTEKEKVTQLLSRYHILTASILRDQCLFPQAIEHLHRAAHLASEHNDYEFLADAYYRQGWTYVEQGEAHPAVQSFRAAESLLKKIPSYMAVGIFNGLGRARAMQTQDSQDRVECLNTLDRAANLVRISAPPGGNWHYLEIDVDRCHVDKSSAFLDIAYPREALRELSYLRYSSDIQRRHALIYALEAQAYFALGKYAPACTIAEESLSIAGAIRSVTTYERIRMIHTQLMATSFKNNPEAARLGVMLARANNEKRRELP